MEYLKNKKYLSSAGGMSQKEKKMAPLNPDYFKVDERSLEDFIDFATKFSKIINYYNFNNNPDGDWSSFFDNDVTVLLMQISAIDTNKIREKHKFLTNSVNEGHNFINISRNLEKVIAFLYETLYTIESWNNKTKYLREFNVEIVKLIQIKFSSLLSKLILFEQEAVKNELIPEKIDLNKTVFAKDWDINITNKDPYTFSGNSQVEKIKVSITYLNTIFNGLLSAVELIIRSSEKHLQYHINESGDIKPHITLFFAFIEMYKYAQLDINKFTRRHLDYYFREILRFNEQKETPDKVHILVELNSETKDCHLKKGTSLSAGSDSEGNELIYQIEKDFVINRARIGKISSVINDNDYFNPEILNKANIEIESFFIDDLKLNHYQDDNLDTLKRNPDFAGLNLGFVICSTVLELSEGTRRIKFRFDLQKYAFGKFIPLLYELIDKDKIQDEDIAFFLSDFFTVSYSNHEFEWIIINAEQIEYKIKRDKRGEFINCLELTVLVGSSDPSIDAYLGEEFEEAAQKSCPVFRFLVNPEKNHLYNLFRLLVIEKMWIDLDVLGVSNLLLQNDFGLLDKSAPYTPFGPQPSLGASFYIGNKVILNNPLSEMYINIDWYNIPGDDNGFADYYKGYEYIDGNDVFKAKVSILKDKIWIPEEDSQVINLFEDVILDSDENKPLNNFRGIDNLDVDNIKIERNKTPENLEFYTDSTRNGVLKLELCYPPNAFGHKEYPELMKKAAAESMKKKKLAITPNEPYTPVIKNLTIDFSSTVVFDNSESSGLKGDLLYYIHPYGKEKVTINQGEHYNIIPWYDRGTELYIGLEEFETPQTLSILFQINEFASDVFDDNEKLEWSFLVGRTWHKIKDNQIIYDSTNQLIRPGIITFDFLNKIETQQNLLLPEGYFWIRCKTGYGVKFVENIIDIKAQGVVAVFKNTENDLTHLIKGLPPKSINSLAEDEDIPEIINLVQPYSSFGGKIKENQEDFYSRVSQRLRHKDRAISIWDYETLILQNFQDVYIAKCIPNTSSKMEVKPGNVLLVVLPRVNKIAGQNIKEPRFTISKIQKIKQFIKQRCSIFVNFEIKNPTYEEVQVKFNVKFHKGIDARYHVKKLNEELKRLLSPWMFEDNIQLKFGETVRAADILYFLDTRDYVDYITNFAIYHIIDKKIINHSVAKRNDILLMPKTPISIFVSANHHIINIIGDKKISDKGGIEDMVVETDFIVEDYKEDGYLAQSGIEYNAVGVDFQIEDEDRRSVEKGNYLVRIKRK